MWQENSLRWLITGTATTTGAVALAAAEWHGGNKGGAILSLAVAAGSAITTRLEYKKLQASLASTASSVPSYDPMPPPNARGQKEYFPGLSK
jgi:hypothetical protein